MPPHLRSLAVLALTLLLGAAWASYASVPLLTDYLPAHIASLPAAPIYAQSLPLEWNEDARWHVLRATSVMAAAGICCAVLLRWRRFPVSIALLMAVLSVASVNCSVAAIRGGWDALDRPFGRAQLEYFGDIPRVNDDPLVFIRDYPTLNRQLSLHAGTHPPGGVLTLWAGSKLFGDSVTAAASLAIALSALAIVPAWWLAKLVGGRRLARHAVPLLLVAPTLVQFGATSMDGVFTTSLVLACATGVWAIRRQSILRACVAGAALWLAAFLTFAAIAVPALLTLLTLVSRWHIRRFAALSCIAASFLAIQLLASWLIGYDFVATAHAAMARDEYAMRTTGNESLRLWFSISTGNLAAFTFGSGLALSAAVLAGALAAMRRAGAFSSRFTFAVIATLLLLAGSTLFTFETERVWLGLVPACVCVAATILRDRWSLALVSVLLATQAVLTEFWWYTFW
jgi:methylthioxylose transferase